MVRIGTLVGAIGEKPIGLGTDIWFEGLFFGYFERLISIESTRHFTSNPVARVRG